MIRRLVVPGVGAAVAVALGRDRRRGVADLRLGLQVAARDGPALGGRGPQLAARRQAGVARLQEPTVQQQLAARPLEYRAAANVLPGSSTHISYGRNAELAIMPQALSENV